MSHTPDRLEGLVPITGSYAISNIANSLNVAKKDLLRVVGLL